MGQQAKKETPLNEVYCPSCGKLIRKKTGWGSPGNPQITCAFCGAEAIDHTALELALRPRDWYVRHRSRSWICALCFLGPAAAFVLCLLLIPDAPFVRSRGFTLLGAAGIILGFILGVVYILFTSSIMIDDQFEREYMESETRLLDPSYRKKLADSGYIDLYERRFFRNK